MVIRQNFAIFDIMFITR